jgi:hypothetical protein
VRAGCKAKTAATTAATPDQTTATEVHEWQGAERRQDTMRVPERNRRGAWWMRRPSEVTYQHRDTKGNVMLRSVLTGLAVLVAATGMASPGFAMPRSAMPTGQAPALQDVKLKCGLNEDGRFFCKDVKKKKKHDDDGGGDNDKDHKKHGKKSKKVLNCEGPNDCGPGYRDLETPGKYGACCELIKDDTTDKAGNGGKVENAPSPPPPEEDNDRKDLPAACRLVENSQEMNCKAPLDAISCSAIENGKMTCCCVK